MSNRARFEHLAPALALVGKIPGDFMEMGVWKGETFIPLAREAVRRGILCHAVDSFVGMAEPCEKDLDESGQHQYPAGALSAGGPEELRKACENIGSAVIDAGFIPAILGKVILPRGISFAHIDLDQYIPTAAALEWAWPRLNLGGVIACHDYWPGRGCLASLAIDEFIKKNGVKIAGRNEASSHVWFQVGAA